MVLGKLWKSNYFSLIWISCFLKNVVLVKLGALDVKVYHLLGRPFICLVRYPLEMYIALYVYTTHIMTRVSLGVLCEVEW